MTGAVRDGRRCGGRRVASWLERGSGGRRCPLRLHGREWPVVVAALLAAATEGASSTVGASSS